MFKVYKNSGNISQPFHFDYNHSTLEPTPRFPGYYVSGNYVTKDNSARIVKIIQIENGKEKQLWPDDGFHCIDRLEVWEKCFQGHIITDINRLGVEFDSELGSDSYFPSDVNFPGEEIGETLFYSGPLYDGNRFPDYEIPGNKSNYYIFDSLRIRVYWKEGLLGPAGDYYWDENGLTGTNTAISKFCCPPQSIWSTFFGASSSYRSPAGKDDFNNISTGGEFKVAVKSEKHGLIAAPSLNFSSKGTSGGEFDHYNYARNNRFCSTPDYADPFFTVNNGYHIQFISNEVASGSTVPILGVLDDTVDSYGGGPGFINSGGERFIYFGIRVFLYKDIFNNQGLLSSECFTIRIKIGEKKLFIHVFPTQIIN